MADGLSKSGENINFEHGNKATLTMQDRFDILDAQITDLRAKNADFEKELIILRDGTNMFFKFVARLNLK